MPWPWSACDSPGIGRRKESEVTVEEALRTALELEGKVRDHYRRAGAGAAGVAAGSFFALMEREEQGHVDYLEAELATWRAQGTLTPGEMATAVPSRAWLEEGVATLGPPEGQPERPETREHLFTALGLEQGISDLYRRLVAEVEDPEAAALFRRFLEIEDGHTALVQAEIDYETRTGYYFDFQEFTLDG